MSMGSRAQLLIFATLRPRLWKLLIFLATFKGRDPKGYDLCQIRNFKVATLAKIKLLTLNNLSKVVVQNATLISPPLGNIASFRKDE